jgi:hypothetical protein
MGAPPLFIIEPPVAALTLVTAEIEVVDKLGGTGARVVKVTWLP